MRALLTTVVFLAAVISLAGDSRFVRAQERPKEISNSIGMKLVQIPSGEFVMGSPTSESGSKDDEREHRVAIGDSFYMSAFEVTQSQYKLVMHENPSHKKGDEYAERDPNTKRIVKKFDSDNYPVEMVTWIDAVDFCKALSQLPEEQNAGRVYRLPTEAEWEYACRAGSQSAYSFGENPNALGDYAWFANNSKGTQPVGLKQPNTWGLYDMHGNVWEWCLDWYGQYPEKAVSDPIGPYVGESRVVRGGTIGSLPSDCRSAFRIRFHPSNKLESIGFRVVISSAQIRENMELKDQIAESAKDMVKITNSIGMKLLQIPKGTFVMGSPESEPGRKQNETMHEVTIGKDFFIGVYEVTQEQYQKVIGANPSHFHSRKLHEDTSRHPVEKVSWEDAVVFCKRLSELPQEKKEGRIYRLPTEAEWEYACRAGTVTAYSFGDDEKSLGFYAWISANNRGQTHPIGYRRPNPWGLFDMHGNVAEWCEDRFGEYPKRSVIDPVGPDGGKDDIGQRVVRGGGPSSARSASRAFRLSDDRGSYQIGFRVALDCEEADSHIDVKRKKKP